MTGREELHGRSADDDAFYEWFLSDHPDAAAERDWRREDHYLRERERAAEVRAWADKVNAQADAPQAARDLAASLGPLADTSAGRAEVDRAEPDDLYVARLRDQHETYMRVSGPLEAHDYRYPAHLIGPEARRHDPPPPVPQPEPRPEPGIEPGW